MTQAQASEEHEPEALKTPSQTKTCPYDLWVNALRIAWSLLCFQTFSFVSFGFSFGLGVGGWGWGGIRTSSDFASLYNILHKDVEQENLPEASMPVATMPKPLVFTAFYAQNIGIDGVLASLYNILHKDVEQENVPEASMPFAIMPKTLVLTVFCLKTLAFTPFSPLRTPYCARMWNKKTCHKRLPCTRKSHTCCPKKNSFTKKSHSCCPKKNSFWNPLNTAFLLRTTPASTNDAAYRTQAKYRALTDLCHGRVPKIGAPCVPVRTIGTPRNGPQLSENPGISSLIIYGLIPLQTLHVTTQPQLLILI